MPEKLNEIANFFKDNIKVKEIIGDYPTDYGLAGAYEYTEKFSKKLSIAQNLLLKMAATIGSSEVIIAHINKMFDFYNRALTNTNYDPQKLAIFYQKCISDMNPQLVDETNRNIFGYYILADYFIVFLKAQTINEMLHIFHSYLVNSEGFYKVLPIIEERTGYANNKVTLRGKETPIAKAIYDNLSDDLECGQTDIVSLSSEKIIMMIKDLGHALTIEIDVEGNAVHVSYFIPKVCNIDMVKSLKGIANIKEDETNQKFPYAKGSFQVPTEEVVKDIIDLIKGVPQDKHMSL